MFKDYMYKLLKTNNIQNINNAKHINNINNIKNNAALQKYILNSTYKSIEKKCNYFNKNKIINNTKIYDITNQPLNNNKILFLIFTVPILLYL